jgi:hypothetical protein
VIRVVRCCLAYCTREQRAGQVDKAAVWLAAAGYGLLDAVDVIEARASTFTRIDEPRVFRTGSR